MNISKETLYHFSCPECKLWWSVANTDDWKPKRMYCPHCGKLHLINYE